MRSGTTCTTHALSELHMPSISPHSIRVLIIVWTCFIKRVPLLDLSTAGMMLFYNVLVSSWVPRIWAFRQRKFALAFPGNMFGKVLYACGYLNSLCFVMQVTARKFKDAFKVVPWCVFPRAFVPTGSFGAAVTVDFPDPGRFIRKSPNDGNRFVGEEGPPNNLLPEVLTFVQTNVFPLHLVLIGYGQFEQ